MQQKRLVVPVLVTNTATPADSEASIPQLAWLRFDCRRIGFEFDSCHIRFLGLTGHVTVVRADMDPILLKLGHIIHPLDRAPLQLVCLVAFTLGDFCSNPIGNDLPDVIVMHFAKNPIL